MTCPLEDGSCGGSCCTKIDFSVVIWPAQYCVGMFMSIYYTFEYVGRSLRCRLRSMRSEKSEMKSLQSPSKYFILLLLLLTFTPEAGNEYYAWLAISNWIIIDFLGTRIPDHIAILTALITPSILICSKHKQWLILHLVCKKYWLRQQLQRYAIS